MLPFDKISIPEATAIQNELRFRVSLSTDIPAIKTIGGADISHNRFSNVVYAGIVVLSYPDMQLLSCSLKMAQTNFPYVPGYLAFREAPALFDAWAELPQKPDVLVLDGHGIAHPRRLGIASTFGVLADHPTIGCAKNLLCGKHGEIGSERFSSSPLTDKGDLVGYALRTKTGVKPVYVSPGNKVSAEDSLQILKHCSLRHRIPEPTRLAHNVVNLFRTGNLQEGYLDMAGN